MSTTADVPEQFVAVIEVQAREQVDERVLRDQARRWFGTCAIRCTGVEVTPRADVDGRPSYRVLARYVARPSSGLGLAAEFLGLNPRVR